MQNQENKKVKTLVYSRVSGYYNPVQNFNKGKAEEFKERKTISTDSINKAIGR